uniref:Sulfotransferase n=1 Tax=Xenopus tropicalis TaxID=8364 RepID=A0A6I8STA8_XENTR
MTPIVFVPPPKNFHIKEILKKVEDEFQVLDDDIFNITYPKSGTHWMSEILNLIKHNGDPTMVTTVPMWSRSPWYETVGGYEEAEKLTSPRIISSHIPSQIFSKSFIKSKAKVIYTMRNPKDVIVSMFYFSKILKIFKEPENFQALLEDFFQGSGESVSFVYTYTGKVTVKWVLTLHICFYLSNLHLTNGRWCY